MDVKEKLMEIVKKAAYSSLPSNTEDFHLNMFVTNLLSHGVTVQEWISASEPPKKYRDEYGELIPFLVCAEGTDYPFRAMYDGKTWGDGIFSVHVKWWMYLPSPPKEKERKDGDGNV